MNLFKRVLITLMSNTEQQEIDKYAEYKIDFNGLVDHEEAEVS